MEKLSSKTCSSPMREWMQNSDSAVVHFALTDSNHFMLLEPRTARQATSL